LFRSASPCEALDCELVLGIEMSFELNCSIAPCCGRTGLSGRTLIIPLIMTTSSGCSPDFTTRNPSASCPVFIYDAGSGLLTVTSAGGGPCAAGRWLLQPASQRLNATTISRSLPIWSRLADVMAFAFVRKTDRLTVDVLSLFLRASPVPVSACEHEWLNINHIQRGTHRLRSNDYL
jgi:hypothetical protein